MNKVVTNSEQNRSESQVCERLQVVRLWFDGGTGPKNPGHGYGSYQIESDWLNHKILKAKHGNPITSNQAEYLTLLQALKWLSHNVELSNIHLRIFSDSMLVVMQIQGSWKTKCIIMRDLRDNARAILACFGKWDIHWNERSVNVRKFGH